MGIPLDPTDSLGVVQALHFGQGKMKTFSAKRRPEPKEKRTRPGLLFGQKRMEFRPEDGQPPVFLAQNV